MSKTLFISAHAPTQNYPQAGQKIALHHLQAYRQSGATVDVVTIANQAEITAATDLLENADRLYTYPLTRFNKLQQCLQHWREPLKFSSRLLPAAVAQIQQLLHTNAYDTVHFEYSHAAACLDRLTLPPQTQTIVSIHDVVFQSFLRRSAAQPWLGLEAIRLFHYEKQRYAACDEIWVLSQKDADLLTSLFSIAADKIVVKPPKLSEFVQRVRRSPSSIEPKSLLFWAAMNRPENEQAILAFVDRCFRPLLQQDPDYKLYIVGANPSRQVQALNSTSIVVTGFVSDPTPYFERAAIGVVPLLAGAGIKLKTLEMLTAGLPVISTSIGAEGVTPVRALQVHDRLDQWAPMIQAQAARLPEVV